MPKKITIPEVDKSIIESNERLKQIEQDLKDSIEIFKEGVEFLQDDIDYFEHMESSNEAVDFLNEMAKDLEEHEDIKSKKYSQEKIHKIKVNIENTQKTLAKINTFITELILNKVEISHYVDEFEKINEQFRENLLKINSWNLN